MSCFFNFLSLLFYDETLVYSIISAVKNAPRAAVARPTVIPDIKRQQQEYYTSIATKHTKDTPSVENVSGPVVAQSTVI